MMQKPLPKASTGDRFVAGPPDSHPNSPTRTDSDSSLPPSLRPVVTDVPVTPGIQLGEYSPDTPDKIDAGLARPPSGYFTANVKKHSESMTKSSREVKQGHEILRQMNMSNGTQRRQSLSETDPVAANPSLGLSGGVISAAFCIPYTLEYRRGAERVWETHNRRGTSALFDSFTYLASNKTPWDHTLVGWTGEVKTADDLTPPETPTDTTITSRLQPLNKESAPILFDGRSLPEAADGLRVQAEDRIKLEQQLGRDQYGKIVPVWLADDNDSLDSMGELCLKDQSRWRMFAERRLYTLFHYKQAEPDDGRAERKSWADYFRMNQKFANRILDIYKPGDIVIVHDYHLFLLPSILRQKVPDMYIAFFLHVPFPSSEFLRCLPQRKEILEGVLGANLCGFQSYSYSRHFVSCCTRITAFESNTSGVNAFGAKVKVGVYPIGIDATVVEGHAFNPVVDEKLQALRKLYQGKKLIVGRDRLDSVRGVAQKLQAFEKFLEIYPEWREKVVLIQVTSPTSLEEDKEPGDKIASKISELVQNINGLYGSLKYSPVQHYPQYLAEEEYFALLRAGDIGLITSVRDGMNTTSLEYILCQRDDHGPLILSEFSGTAGSLRDAIHINPWDLVGVAKQINAALTMSEEKKYVMHRSLYEHVKAHNVQMWCNSFLKRLLSVLNSHSSTIATPLLDKAALVKQYRDSSQRIFLLDYDGTLTPIVGDPAAALPSERLIRTLKALAMDEHNKIWIISGRDRDFLERHLGHINGLGFSAEHGAFIRQPGCEKWEDLTETCDMSWRPEVLKVMQRFTEDTRGSFIEHKSCTFTWHYRASDPEQGAAQAKELRKELLAGLAKSYDIDIMLGKANIEARPRFINKGVIAKRLVAEYGDNRPEFILCLGDDFTDEDMFRSLNSSQIPESSVFTVVVGASNKMTLARWHLLEPRDVINALGLLNGGAAEWKDLGSLAVVEGHVPEELPGVKVQDELPGEKL